jgi:hypothetical protein
MKLTARDVVLSAEELGQNAQPLEYPRVGDISKVWSTSCTSELVDDSVPQLLTISVCNALLWY